MASPVKRRLPAAVRRERIVSAALDAFGTRGYEATSMGEIAVAAGVTRSVLYDHFASKQALFLALLEEESARLVAHVGERITGSGDARSRMRATVDGFFAFAEAHPFARRMLAREDGAADPEIAAARRRIEAAQVTAVTALLAPDAEAAGIEPGSTRAAAMVALLIAGLDGVARWWTAHPDVPRAELVDAAMATVWTGLEGLLARRS